MPFAEHVALLQLFIEQRDQLVGRLESLLNAQRRPPAWLQDGALLSRLIEECFFSVPGLPAQQASLRGQLQQVHWASGFRPRDMPGLHNDLVDPGQMMMRAFHLWRQTRWPGRNGRLRYAHTLFSLYLLRALELLVMRIWDAGASVAGQRLGQVQSVLDHLWVGIAPDQPVLLRDARWLFPLAQSPTTNELGPYFDVLEHIAGSLTPEDRLEIHRAAVVMAGGHLRSQLRHYLMNRHVCLDEHGLVLTSRNSNALDFAMLVQGLVPLLQAYEDACRGTDAEPRLRLASAICQGICVDPELFVNRTDLLAPYTMIEHLFVTTDAQGRGCYSHQGKRHVALLQEYAERIGQQSVQLLEDCPRFEPLAGCYSPYGLIYGFSSNITEHIALKSLHSGTGTPFTLEDVFSDGDAGRLAWVNGWRKLPHITEGVQQLFEYPQQFAQDIHDRLEQALRKRVAQPGDRGRTGRLHIQSGGRPQGGVDADEIPALPARYIGSSDPARVAAQQAHHQDPDQLQRDRQEGMFLLSYGTPGGCVAISKDVLTDVLGEGRDASIAGLPAPVADALILMCRGLAVAEPNRH
ncbi:MAG TPA: hypothetical protein VMF03_08750 [Steroidobacteraceae bacterium]|nr:hypothetical protein [Steroidobacteraceae bacterium]